jgi:uncharacterized protein YjbI with pentapeptide repeats
MGKCSVCSEVLEDKYFDKEQNKCILHCEKDNWYIVINGVKDGWSDNKNAEKDWSKSEAKISFFWKKIRTVLEKRDEDADYRRGNWLDLSKIIFPKFEEQSVPDLPHEDDDAIFEWHDNFLNQNIVQSISSSHSLEVRLNFTGATFLDKANFKDYKFKKDVLFDSVSFKDSCDFTNTTFDSVSFSKVNFFKSVLFENAKVNLNQAKSFENSIFHDEVKFYNTIFGIENSNKVFSLDFWGTQFKNLHFLSCTFHSGLRFYKDVNIDNLDIQSTNLTELYIAAKVPTIQIRGNGKEINKLTIKHNKLNDLMIHNCIIKGDFLLNDEKNEIFELNSLNFKESTFKGKVKIQFYNIKKEANFYNTKFEDLADFYRTEFKEVVFERTDFKDIVVFSEVEFKNDVNFKYTKFLGYSAFRDTVIKGKLNLRDTIFGTEAEANFLDITSEKNTLKDIKVENRETARLIKSFHEYSNNIIESNKFYALEMKEREKELDALKTPLEWIVFKMHSISSNHSQSWAKPLIWIFIISLLFSCVNFLYNLNSITSINIEPIIGSIFLILIYNLGFYDSKTYKVFSKYILIILLFINYILITKDFSLTCISNNINPFSIMTSLDEISFFGLIFKVVIAYLIYQFIISIRQNTRRK